MDNDTKLLQEIHAEVKGARMFFVLILLAVIGFTGLTMVMVQALSIEVRSPPAKADAKADAGAPAK